MGRGIQAVYKYHTVIYYFIFVVASASPHNFYNFPWAWEIFFYQFSMAFHDFPKELFFHDFPGLSMTYHRNTRVLNSDQGFLQGAYTFSSGSKAWVLKC